MSKNSPKLADLVGQFVSVQNVAHYEMSYEGVEIQVFGTLEVIAEDGEEPSYYVRVNETYSGPSGIGFKAKHVKQVEQKLHHAAIVIR